MTQDRRSAPGKNDRNPVERAEALLDEAVGQAAKGSYREATEKAEEALAIDPENVAARDLLDSYRRQSTDDDERRRRRRSIAAAAAAIEEMVESYQLEQASAATDALVMQFGVDAPVEDLRQRIDEARASHLDFDELDAAIDAIRVSDTTSTPAARGDHGGPTASPGGTIAGEIEEHLRAGRLDQASSALGRLEAEPGARDRAAKLRTRIEEALHVAAEHRREEEILIATAAIEERIRRGNLDDAAERLDDLARRHGDTAPIEELEQRLAEARESRASTLGATTDESEDADAVVASVVPPPVFQSIVDEERGGRGRMIAIAFVVLIALAAGAWWLTQRGDGGEAKPAASEPSTTEGSASVEGVAPGGSLDAAEPAAEDTTAGPIASAPSGTTGVAQVQPSIVTTRNDAVAPAPSTGAAPATTGRAPATDLAEPAVADAASANSPATNADAATAPPVPPAAAPEAPIVSERSAPAADASTPNADVVAPNTGSGTTDVVVEALPAAQSPPPPAPAPAPPAIQIEVAPPPAAPAEGSASSTPSTATDGGARTEPAAATQPAAAAAEPRRAAAPTSSILGCGDPGVVCVKALQVPTPRYPAAARSRRMSGNVVVMALVDESGHVVQTRIESGSIAFFNDAAVEAAKRATFQPATRQGVPGQSWARLTFKFDQQ